MQGHGVLLSVIVTYVTVESGGNEVSQTAGPISTCLLNDVLADLQPRGGVLHWRIL